MSKAIGSKGPKNVYVHDRRLDSSHCYYCGANMKYSAFPHFCKEITFQSMPILEFEKFDASDD